MSSRALGAFLIAFVIVMVELGIATRQANDQGAFVLPNREAVFFSFIVTWIAIYGALGLVQNAGRRMGISGRVAKLPTRGEPNLKRAHQSRLTAARLALILGCVGIHKFYLGRKTHGIIYILACWTFIPLISGVIEFFWLRSMSDEAFAGRFPTRA